MTPTKHEKRSRRWTVRAWLVRLLLAVVVGLGVALAIDIARVGGIETWLTRYRLPPPYVASGFRIEVNRIPTYIDCRGSGSPTVILESGLGTGAAGWGFVPERLVEAGVRVCSWDRPGIGNSEPMGLHGAVALAEHLRATLDAAGERGRFVIVGHSLGGVYARIFAARFREEIAGIVLIDPYLPDVRPIELVDVDPALRAEWLAGLDATNRQVAATEDLDWDAVEAELAAATLDDIPLELVFVDQRFRWDERFDPWEADLIETWRSMVLRLSADSRLTIAENSTHMIQWDRPDVVEDAILRLVRR